VLTLDEFSERVGTALAAQTRGELERVTADLPALARRDRDRADESVRRVVAIVGSNRRKARWRVGRRASAVAVLGASWVDLRHARLEEGEVTVRAFTFFGTVKVIVPEGVGTDVTGLPVFGVKTDATSAGDDLEGAPVVRVKGFPLFGSVRVMNRPPYEVGDD